MAVTSKNIAYVRYDNTGRIVPGGPIVTSVKPKVGNWVAVSDVLTTTPNYKLRGFIRYIKNGDYVAGSLILQHDAPQDGNWKEVYVLNPACCAVPTTTTTTSSSSTTTTTTTTTTPPTTTTTTTIFSDCKSYSLTNTTEGTIFFGYSDCCTGGIENIAILPGQTIDDIHHGSLPTVPGLIVSNLIDPYICPATTTTTTTATPSTTTTTTTITAVNFDFTLTCNVTTNVMTAGNPTGGSGTYQFTSAVYGTEVGALNSTSWNPPNLGALYSGYSDATYWVACRDANNPSNIIAKSVFANCQSGTTTTTTTIITPTTTTTTTVGPVQYDLGFVCDPNGGSSNPRATNITGGNQPLYFTRFTYLTEAEALDPDNEYFGPYQGLYAVQWGTSYIPPDNPLVWVVIKDSLDIKTAKSVQLDCPTITTTTTQS